MQFPYWKGGLGLGAAPQSTQNLIVHSQNLTLAPWSNEGTQTTSNGAPGGVVAPDGTSTVTLCTPNAASADTYEYQPCVGGAGVAGLFTGSIWIRRAVGNALSGSFWLRVDAGNGIQVSSILITATDTWTRYNVSGTFDGSQTSVRLLVGAFSGGWGDTTVGPLLLWGGQVQQGNLGPYRAVA